MRDQQARQILQALVSGIDPFAGQGLAAGTVLQHADVMRAMLAGCSSLEERTGRASRRSQQPKNIGKAWTPEEQERLAQAFKSGENLEQIAIRHGRTIRGIESRVEILGMITTSPSSRHGRPRYCELARQRRAGFATSGSSAPSHDFVAALNGLASWAQARGYALPRDVIVSALRQSLSAERTLKSPPH